MKVFKNSLNFIFLIIITLLAIHWEKSLIKEVNCINVSVSLINPYFEIEPKFLITKKKEVLFSANESNSFALYCYSINNGRKKLTGLKEDTFNPFIIEGRYAGLKDDYGKENFTITDTALYKYIGNQSIKAIFTFNNGFLIVLQVKGDSGVYLIDLIKQTQKLLINNVQRLHSASLSSDNRYLIANYDHKLSYIDLKNNLHSIQLATNSNNESMNAFLYKDAVYFSSNETSEYYQLYKITINSIEAKPQKLLSTNYDLRMPKINDGLLYYIEIKNSEYLLRSFNFKSCQIKNITTRGVIYNYDFYDQGNIVLSYTDFFTPKCILIHNKKTGFTTNLTGVKLDLKLSYQLIEGTKELSSGYIIKPNNKQIIKGVILYFHPGLHSDFSPRWDFILMNLSNNGYIVITPNFPMSSGFGKSHYNSDFEMALTDIKKWKNYISKTYNNLPLYYLASSSGNILMERSIKDDKSEVKAFISLFGISSQEILPTSLPGLYILGKNDPIISWDERISELNPENNANISTISLINEGHWLRKKKNMEYVAKKTIEFLCKN